MRKLGTPAFNSLHLLCWRVRFGSIDTDGFLLLLLAEELICDGWRFFGTRPPKKGTARKFEVHLKAAAGVFPLSIHEV